MVFFSFVSVLELYEDFFILKTNILYIVIVEVDKPCFFHKKKLYMIKHVERLLISRSKTHMKRFILKMLIKS